MSNDIFYGHTESNKTSTTNKFEILEDSLSKRYWLGTREQINI